MSAELIGRDGGPRGLPTLYLVRSPNHYTYPLYPRGLVIHETEGSYAGAVDWFSQTRSQVSAHLVLKEDGSEATQCVGWRYPAWHAVNANSHTIGIELAGMVGTPHASAQILRAARICGFLCRRFGIPARQGDGHGYGGIVRHRDLGTYGGNHSDPQGFNWNAFLAMVLVEVRRGGYRPVWGVDR